MFGLLGGLATALVLGAIAGPSFGFTVGLALGLVIGLMTSALMIGLVSSDVWDMWGCQVYLHLRHRTPLGLMRFLEDARGRHLLRTVGPVYQFRHAALQDRLAPLPTALTSRKTH
jgi:hypothetical protein